MQVIREAFNLLFKNFLLFGAIVLTVWLPGEILINHYVYFDLSGADEWEVLRESARLYNMIEAAFGPIYIGGIIYAVLSFKQGRPISYAKAIKVGFKNWGDMFATRIIAGFFIFIGLICFIIPGIINSFKYSLIDAILIDQGLKGNTAIKASSRLTKGKKWLIFGAGILSWIAAYILYLVPYFLLYLLGIDPEQNLTLTVMLECLGHLLMVVIVIVTTLIYDDAQSSH